MNSIFPTLKKKLLKKTTVFISKSVRAFGWTEEGVLPSVGQQLPPVPPEDQGHQDRLQVQGVRVLGCWEILMRYTEEREKKHNFDHPVKQLFTLAAVHRVSDSAKQKCLVQSIYFLFDICFILLQEF